LDGRIVVVPRAAEQAGELLEALEAEGAKALHAPVLRFAPVEGEDLAEWRRALERRTTYTHLVFTSRVAVRVFVELSDSSSVPLDSWIAHATVATVGERTAREARELGLPVSIVGPGAGGIDLAEKLVEGGVGPSMRVLLPQSAIARPELEQRLQEAGSAVDAVAIYRTGPSTQDDIAPLLTAVENGDSIDAVLFASPSAVHAFLEITGNVGRTLFADARTHLVAIGRTTRDELEAQNGSAIHTAQTPSARSLVEATIDALA